MKYLRGEIDESKLLAAATDNDKLTEARCFLGLDMEQKGRKEEALAHFRWVKEHGNPGFYEYTIAQAELDRLTGKVSLAWPAVTHTERSSVAHGRKTCVTTFGRGKPTIVAILSSRSTRATPAGRRG